MSTIIDESTCVTAGLPLELCCEKCKALKDPLSNARQRYAILSRRPWDVKVWGNHKHCVKVKLCIEVRKYLNLSCHHLLFDEKNVHPNPRNKCRDAERTIDDRTDKITKDFENNAGEIKAKFKFDLRNYYEDEIKRLNHRMSLVRDVCLEKLLLISTLRDERIKFKHLLEK